MLKRLRIKFVCIMMAIVTGMLCVIFGLVIHFTAQAMENQSIQMMQAIVPNSAIRPGIPGENVDEIRLPFFSIFMSRSGEMFITGGGFFDLSDEENLSEIIQKALDSDAQTGVLKEYNLRFWKSVSHAGQRILFVDISSELATMKHLVQNCVVIGVCSFLIFLTISLLLARWAIKPVEQAWEQQKQFVADASHELKTPLTVIMTNAELLQNRDYNESARQPFESSILVMSYHMRGLVEGLLELARVDNGAVKTNYEEVDFSQLVAEGVLPFEPLYFEKELELSTAIEKGIHLKGSVSHLKQVLDILLDNAMKYSAPRGRVQIKLKKQASHCTLSVASPGEPISQEDLKNIFKRFYRIDKARSRDGSYGLGLSIAQSIISEHRGKIWAESAGGINSFLVQLPVIS